MHYASRWLPFLVRCSRCITKDSSSGRIIHHVPVMRLKTRKSTTCLLKFFQPEGFEHNNGQRYEIVWGGWYLISRSSLFILNVAVNFPLLCTLKENNFETLSIDLSCTQFSPVVLWTAGPCDLFLSYELKDIYERRIALGGGGGGTPLYKPYRYVPSQRVWFLHHFGLKRGGDFAHFGLE